MWHDLITHLWLISLGLKTIQNSILKDTVCRWYESQYLEILIFCSYLGHFQVESFNQGSFSYLYRDTLNQISLLNTLHNKT